MGWQPDPCPAGTLLQRAPLQSASLQGPPRSPCAPPVAGPAPSAAGPAPPEGRLAGARQLQPRAQAAGAPAAAHPLALRRVQRHRCRLLLLLLFIICQQLGIVLIVLLQSGGNQLRPLLRQAGVQRVGAGARAQQLLHQLAQAAGLGGAQLRAGGSGAGSAVSGCLCTACRAKAVDLHALDLRQAGASRCLPNHPSTHPSRHSHPPNRFAIVHRVAGGHQLPLQRHAQQVACTGEGIG